MPASFKVDGDRIIPDFGESAMLLRRKAPIARVAPVDSGFWWLFVLRAYVKATGDLDLAHQPNFQPGIRLLLDLYLIPRFEMLPTMLVPDGSFTIDRCMGVYGHPLDIQALFYMALRSALELLPSSPENDPYLKAARDRATHLAYHIRQYYWLNLATLYFRCLRKILMIFSVKSQLQLTLSFHHKNYREGRQILIQHLV